MTQPDTNHSRGLIARGLALTRRPLPATSYVFWLMILAMVLFVLASGLVGERFTSAANLRSMSAQVPEFGLLALAMMITLLKGGLNLSIIATANMTALTVGATVQYLDPQLGTASAIVLALAAGMIVATVIGLANGFLVAVLRVSPIIATLGTMILIQGISVGLSGGGVVSGFPDFLQFVGQGLVLGVPFSLLLLLAACAVTGFVLRRTTFGESLYLIGSNEMATRYSGVNTDKVVILTYVASSWLAFLAGLVMLGRFNSANASYGESYLLVTILAAVLGGINPFGGFGRVFGLVVALAILQIVSSAFNQLTISPHLTTAIWGILLIAVSAISTRFGSSRS